MFSLERPVCSAIQKIEMTVISCFHIVEAWCSVALARCPKRGANIAAILEG